MNRNFTWLLTAVLVGCIHRAEAQQPKKIPVIGYISSNSRSSPGPLLGAFRQALSDLGYNDEKNIRVEYRYTEGKSNRAAGFVAELLQLKIDLLVSPNLGGIFAAKQASKTIPIVIIANTDPVAAGIVESLSHPGGNITGVTTSSRDLSGKRLELLTEIVPRLSVLAVLRHADSQNGVIGLKEYEAAANVLRIAVQSLEVQGLNPDLEETFEIAVKRRAQALATITGSSLFQRQRQIADLAIKMRLPSLFEGSTWVESGGLMSYSADDPAVYRRAATYVDKILKGAKPAELPVEQPTKFELVINLKTAREIGLTIPPHVLARADRVIR